MTGPLSGITDEPKKYFGGAGGGYHNEMETITNDEIKRDIKRYQDRIARAEKRLAALPDTAYGWNQQRELNRKQRILLDEIRHVAHLIAIAREGLSEAYDA